MAPLPTPTVSRLSLVSAVVASAATWLVLRGVASGSLVAGRKEGLGVGAFAAGHAGHRLLHRTLRWDELDTKLVCANANVRKHWADAHGLCPNGEWAGVPPEIKAVQALGVLAVILGVLTAVAAAVLAASTSKTVVALFSRLFLHKSKEAKTADDSQVLALAIAGASFAGVATACTISAFAVWAATSYPASLLNGKVAIPLWAHCGKKLMVSDPVEFTLATDEFVGIVMSSVGSMLALAVNLVIAVKASGNLRSATAASPSLSTSEAGVELHAKLLETTTTTTTGTGAPIVGGV